MKKDYTIIFDMDGTLYSFDNGDSKSFEKSQFYKDLKLNIYTYIDSLNLSNTQNPIDVFNYIFKKYKGEMSIGFATEYNVDVYDYFKKTWYMEPKKYIQKNDNLREDLIKLKNQSILLTAAPKIWADKVLSYLNIADIFGNHIYTGESPIRKPDPLIFLEIIKNIKIDPSQIISIGDQEYSDIIPAKQVGMKTIKIGRDKKTVADYCVNDIQTALQLINSLSK